jgi:hypothetical protein
MTVLATPDLSCARCHRALRSATQPALPQDADRGRVLVVMRRWPDGHLCSGCYAKACETYGVCSGCSVDRLLPGIGPTGERLCTDCAGGIGDFTCTRCGTEGWLHYAGVCGRCVLAERLTAILDDGSGAIRPELIPLFESVVAMSRPRSGILWLTKPHVPPILQALAQGHVPLSHDGLSTLSPWRSVIFIRDLLIGCGTLPPLDRFLFLFEQWLPGWLETLPDEEHRKALNRFATWQLLRQLRATASTEPIGHYRNQNARSCLRQSAAFLVDLHDHGRALADCTQADLDRWHASATGTQKMNLRPFLRWAIKARQTRRLTLPPSLTRAAAPISQQQRFELIRRIHAGTGMDLTEQVIGLLILLYAQPLNKIVRLTVDDVLYEDGQVFLRLGVPPAPIPEPFAQIVTDYLARRSNLTTATNPGSRLLFPGRRSGQPLHPTSMRLRLQRLGIPNLDGRSRAIRELFLQAPPSVVAAMLGYNEAGAEVIAAHAGTTWKRYAAGDHTRTRTPARAVE